MPSKTPTGLPYPLSTEPVKDGATAIQALTAALDVRIQSGSSVVTLNGTLGDAQIPFPVAFKSGTQPTFIPVMSSPMAGFTVASYQQYTNTVQGSIKIATAAGGIPNSGSYRVEWIAVGTVT